MTVAVSYHEGQAKGLGRRGRNSSSLIMAPEQRRLMEESLLKKVSRLHKEGKVTDLKLMKSNAFLGLFQSSALMGSAFLIWAMVAQRYYRVSVSKQRTLAIHIGAMAFAMSTSYIYVIYPRISRHSIIKQALASESVNK